MELPFVYIDLSEQNEAIANVGTFLTQARRILASSAVSDEVKKSVFDVSTKCISNVKRYYQAKEKEAQLTKRDAEVDEKLFQVEKELIVKERTNSELRSSVAEKKLRIKLSEMTIERSRERTRDLLRQRKELEEENKRLVEQVERNSAAFASSLRIACEQKDRLRALVDNSPRLARQNNKMMGKTICIECGDIWKSGLTSLSLERLQDNFQSEDESLAKIEKDAVNALSNRLEELQLQKSHLQKEEERLKKELELQTVTPLRVFMVNFAKVTLRTMEMQEKLREARKIFEQLKAEEAERRKKSGPSEYDVFDASFLSQDLSLRKVHGNLQQIEQPTTILPTVPEAIEDESESPETATTECSHNSPSAEPPCTSSRDIVMARTTATKNYVEQQSESVAEGVAVEVDDNDSGEMTRDEEEGIPHEHNLSSPETNDEVITVAGEDHGNRTNDVIMGGTVYAEEVQQDVGEAEDFSDDDCAIDGTVKDKNANRIMEENAMVEDGQYQGHLSKDTASLAQKMCFSGEVDPPPKSLSSQDPSANLRESQGSRCSSQESQRSSDLLRTLALHRQASASDESKMPSCGAAPLQPSEPSQESGCFFSVSFNRESSPIHEGFPFTFNESISKDDFDPTAALNISTHSNDPGADFLSLIESATEKRVNEHHSPADFSLSLFGGGGATDGTASGDSNGEFVFDFGSPSQCDDGNDDAMFRFNFGANSEDQSTGGKEDAFSFFNF